MLSGQGFYQPSSQLQMIKGHPLAPDIGAWIFNTGMGTVVPDLTGNNRHCILGPQMVWRNKLQSQGGGWCSGLSSYGNYMGAGILPLWRNFSLPVTITAIIKGAASNGDWQGIYTSSLWNGIWPGGVHMHQYTNTVGVTFTNGSGSYSTNRRTQFSTVPITAGKIYVVTGVISSYSSIDIYVNGVLSNAGLTGSAPGLGFYTEDAGGRIAFAANAFYGGGYQSDVHAVFIYNRALNSSQAAWTAKDPYAAFRPVNTQQVFSSGVLTSLAERTLLSATIF